MPQENEILKLRFKLKTGEEFEAQGDSAFISAQKEAFLNLVKAPKAANSASIYSNKQESSAPEIKATPQSTQHSSSYFQSKQSSISAQKQSVQTPSGEVWDKVSYFDGDNIIIRRKSKLVKPQIAALIVLSAAKILIAKEALSALELSKSLKLSGYLKPGQRLDRLLEPEIRESHLSYEGSKRNRLYRISATGQAKAYLWAEKLLQEF